MRTAVVLLSTLAVALAAVTCGQPPIKPDLTRGSIKSVSAGRFDQLISGGNASVPYSWPWMVALVTKDWFDEYVLRCGGSIIANGWVMTSAQCVYNDHYAKTWMIKAGVFDVDDNFEGQDEEQEVDIKAIHVHPQYDPFHSLFDVALLELKRPLLYNNHTRPVCLPKTDTAALTYPDDDLWVTGWGARTGNSRTEKGLHQVNVPYVNSTVCKKENPVTLNEDVMFCAGGQGHGACKDDTGRPLVKAAPSGSWYQYGIVMWDECGGVTAGVYSRVATYCDWISMATNGAADCQNVL
ncbi:hypothetical protein PRIPAC_89387 [Pristionchus pacificus]|uniref:Trypsin n=1 Tax=Pristionchus pacificus TaxID=54126 RepID=A0A454XRY5_PRIPA|nr:hypothetical protein PRIPAC_89387 [Pristionchus pacificus]|eukprot:PDM61154.1 Trypsin [Pristionchus pacificus]